MVLMNRIVYRRDIEYIAFSITYEISMAKKLREGGIVRVEKHCEDRR